MVAVKRHLPAETRLKGVPLSPGVALGRPCFYVRRSAAPESNNQTAPHSETQRLRYALRWLVRQRSALARDAESRLGPEHAEIFEAHRLMLADETFQQRLLMAIEETACSAAQAVETELDLYRQQLDAAGSEYLRQRVADIDEIQQALLGYLNHVVDCRRCRDAADCSIGQCRQRHDHILVGREINASLPIETDDHTIGFIVEKGGPNSHAVILARALHCPVIGNVQNLPASIPSEAQVLIDGNIGEVILNPTAETLAHYESTLAEGGNSLRPSEPVPGLKVMANIERSADVSAVLAAGAEGVGLYRTEMELLVAGRLLTETEQTERYSDVVKLMAGRPVCIRLLDLGGDKSAEWLESERQGEAGAEQRGARFLLSRPDILRAQARALARAGSHGPIHVLYPMITGIEQFLELRALFDQAVADLPPGRLQHGVLFEVPAACLAAARILDAADFGCIGTNDLIQYLFGADRSAAETSRPSCFEADSVLWDIIRQLSRTAARAGKPMAICGELAGNPDLTRKIMQAGITTVSTSPSHIARVRRAARV